MDKFTLELSSPITDEEWDMIMDVDFDNTDKIFFSTRNGSIVEFKKVQHPHERGYFYCPNCGAYLTLGENNDS